MDGERDLGCLHIPACHMQHHAARKETQQSRRQRLHPNHLQHLTVAPKHFAEDKEIQLLHLLFPSGNMQPQALTENIMRAIRTVSSPSPQGQRGRNEKETLRRKESRAAGWKAAKRGAAEQYVSPGGGPARNDSVLTRRMVQGGELLCFHHVGFKASSRRQ